MCRKQPGLDSCCNYECPHNLFWEGLNLKREETHTTKRSREIRNCCCLIKKPWTAREIGNVWGLPVKKIVRYEAMAWEKIHRGGIRDVLSTSDNTIRG